MSEFEFHHNHTLEALQKLRTELGSTPQRHQRQDNDENDFQEQLLFSSKIDSPNIAAENQTQQQIRALIDCLPFGLAMEPQYLQEYHRLSSVSTILDRPLPQKDNPALAKKKQVKAQLKGEAQDRQSIDPEFREFIKLTIQVGQIAKVDDHPNASDLYVLSIDIGSRLIQICANLRKTYPQPSDLFHKKVLVVTNLKKGKKMMGLDSFGMIFGAVDPSNKESLKLLFLQDTADTGAVVDIENFPHMPIKEVLRTYFQTKKVDICFESIPDHYILVG